MTTAAPDQGEIRRAYNCLLIAIFRRAIVDLDSRSDDIACAAALWLSDGGEDFLDNLGGDCQVLRAHLAGARQPALRLEFHE